ncbi:hypothetical protein ACFL9U_08730 [Thermodesulfobacteriota bacterium]
MKQKQKYPDCFGNLDTVFPLGENDLRSTPARCLACFCKTDCLRTAMAGEKGLEVQEEILDRAYSSGILGFVERWSQKKAIFNRKNKLKDTGSSPKELE